MISATLQRIARPIARSAPTLSRSFATAPAAAKLPEAKLSEFQYFKKYYLSDAATYPIILIITGACSMLSFALYRQARGNPNVKWDKGTRLSALDDQTEEESTAHYDHPVRALAKKNFAQP